MAPSRRTSDAAPYLTHDVTHLGRHTLIPAENNGRTRKPTKTKTKKAEREEEMRLNLGYPYRNARSGAQSTPNRGQGPSGSGRDDGETCDYPPPPSYEATAAASASVSALHLPLQQVITAPAPPREELLASVERIHADPGPSYAASIRLRSYTPPLPEPTQTDSDESSIEIVDLEPSTRWEIDRQDGIPFKQRADLEFKRHQQRATAPNSPSMSVSPRRNQSFHRPTPHSPTPSSRFLGSQLSLRIPGDQFDDDDRGVDASDGSTPTTPRRKNSSRLFHVRSHSPQPSASVISLLRNPSPFFKSTPTLCSPSPASAHHAGGDHSLSRKLFHLPFKSKERFDDWEVLDTTDSYQSMTADLPPPSAYPGSNRVGGTGTANRPVSPVASEADSYRSADSYQSYDDDEGTHNYESPYHHSRTSSRPASPPFVSRHVRRFTSSSHHGPSSAPVSPVSSSSASVFSSSTLSLSQATISDTRARTTPPPDHHYVYRAGPSPPASPTSTITGDSPVDEELRGGARTPTTPTVTYVDYNVSPVTPTTAHGPSPPLPANPVTPPRGHALSHHESLQGRGRSLSRELGSRSAPAYSSIFPSTTKFPFSNEKPTIPVPPTHAQPRVESPSPRRHYAGRPLPRTPPMSPSLTWIVDRAEPLTPELTQLDSPIAGHSQENGTPTRRQTPPVPTVPEGDLIDLSDEYDHLRPGAAERRRTRIASLPPDLFDVEEDSLSDSGPVSPTEPVTPTNGQASSSSVTLASPASFAPSSEPIPFAGFSADATDIHGLVSRLGDGAHQDGSDYDALLLIADFIGPASPRLSPNINSASGAGAIQLADVFSSCLVGKVEVERRRVTKDGRVKLKLSLLGLGVDKCAICLSQFRDKESGVLGAKCQHAFHEKCLRGWLARNQTCPLCRERLDACD